MNDKILKKIILEEIENMMKDESDSGENEETFEIGQRVKLKDPNRRRKEEGWVVEPLDNYGHYLVALDRGAPVYRRPNQLEKSHSDYRPLTRHDKF